MTKINNMSEDMGLVEDITEDKFLNSEKIDNEFESEMLNYALHYAKAGYAVILLHNLTRKKGIIQCSCKSGINCPFPGKHPRTANGSKDATTDESKIIAWWDKHPNGNIGLLAGKETGFFVLDIDIKPDAEIPYNGEETLELIQEDYKLLLKDNFDSLPATLSASSGSGGRHLYFKYNFDLLVKNSASLIGQGLDIKSDNNYIIAPPSNHKCGRNYEWFGVDTPVEDAPEWLMYEIQKAMAAEEPKSTKSVSSVKTTSTFILDKNGKIPVNKRNMYLHKYVSGLVNSFSKEEVLSRAFKINNDLFQEPLTDLEITRTVDWAWNKFVLGKSSRRRRK